MHHSNARSTNSHAVAISEIAKTTTASMVVGSTTSQLMSPVVVGFHITTWLESRQEASTLIDNIPPSHFSLVQGSTRVRTRKLACGSILTQ